MRSPRTHHLLLNLASDPSGLRLIRMAQVPGITEVLDGSSERAMTFHVFFWAGDLLVHGFPEFFQVRPSEGFSDGR